MRNCSGWHRRRFRHLEIRPNDVRAQSDAGDEMLLRMPRVVTTSQEFQMAAEEAGIAVAACIG